MMFIRIEYLTRQHFFPTLPAVFTPLTTNSNAIRRGSRVYDCLTCIAMATGHVTKVTYVETWIYHIAP